MTADFLLELLSEEIPARMQAGARNDLARMFAEELQRVGLASEAIEVFSTPRRLAMIARGLPLETETVTRELKGPKIGASKQAIEGFLRKNGVAPDQLVERAGTYFVDIVQPGRPTSELLKEIIPLIVWRFPWPKSMRWGRDSIRTDSLRWVRPLHGAVAILGDKIVDISMDMAHVYQSKSSGDVEVVPTFTGLTAGAATVGHRFHNSGPITIGGPRDYLEKLKACHVIVDQTERERIIREGAAKAAKEAGLSLVEDEGLVVENAGLTEWPVPLLGRFEADYLDVPREVIVLTMRANQKYFACTDKNGALAPAFVCIANIDSNDGGEAIIDGNRRVLAARLADARFFWEQDLKVPLESQAAKLSGIVFHEKLGTIFEKSERVAKLARWLAKEGIVKGAEPERVDRAARLAKADLVSGMVGEFPELQGVIGGYIARAQGEPDAVADAIRDHYKPVGQGDEVPSAPVTVAVSLADRLDTLVGFFGRTVKPTGSKDPFALRRSMLGLLAIITENGLRASFRKLIWQAAGNYTAYFEAVHEDLTGFAVDRLKVQQREAGVRHDLIDAVFALGGEDDLVRLLARVRALQDFVETQEGGDLLTAYKRAANILKKEKWSGDPASAPAREDVKAEEQALMSALDEAEPRASAAIEKEDFTGAMAALASLRDPIDAFFDHVTVNVDDPGTRARRLDLLMRFRDAVDRVADFSKIEG